LIRVSHEYNDRVYYNRYNEIKTRNSSVIMFLVMMEMMKEEENRDSEEIKRLRR